MKPEDMHHMMEGMMSKKFSGMKVEDRIQFCTTMMPKCLTKVFDGVSPEAKEKLRKEMTNKMTSITVILKSCRPMSTSARPLRLAPSSILSIIGGSLMIISGFVSLVTLGIPGYYGMMGPGVMMPIQPSMGTAIAVIYLPSL